MIIKILLLALTMSPTFQLSQEIVGRYEYPQECNAAYLAKQFDLKKARNVEYECRTLDKDGNVLPLNSGSTNVRIIRPPSYERPDFVIELRSR